MLLQSNWFIIGATFDVIGKVLIGLTVLLVHQSLMKEHKIDRLVIKRMKNEQIMGITGIIFILVGYLIHVFFNV